MQMAGILLASCSLLATPLVAEDTVTALRALRLLPQDDMRNIARIEARSGTPAPERWYLIVHDPSDANGLHEFVVAGREIVATRPISQFVETVKPDEVINPDTLKIDSDVAVKIAKEYAAANNVLIYAIDYELKKEGAEAVPVWKISCLDETGKSVAELALTATKGTVVSHIGFASAPQPTPEKKQKLKAYAESEVAPPKPRNQRNVEIQQDASDTERKGGIGQTFKNVGNTFKHFFTGHE